MFTFAEKLKQMSNIEHKDVGVSSLKGTPSRKIYIKTSTEAVYNPEGVTQEYINNHVDGSNIVNGTVTNNKIANGAVSMNKLDNETQTLIQRGADSSWTPKGDFNIETTYDANDVVFDPVTNSSYLSLRADNTGHPVDENDEEYEEGWWMKILDGSYVNRAIDEMEAAIAQAIEDAQEDISELISDSQATIDAAVSGANSAAQSANTAAVNAENKIAWVEEQVDSLVAYEVDDELDEESIIPVQNKVVTDNLIADSAITLSNYPTTKGKYISPNTNKWVDDNDYRYMFVPVGAGKKYRFKANASLNGRYAVMQNNNTSGNAAYATGCSLTNVAVDTESTFTVPENGAYLYIMTQFGTGNHYPQSLIEIKKTKDILLDVKESTEYVFSERLFYMLGEILRNILYANDQSYNIEELLNTITDKGEYIKVPTIVQDPSTLAVTITAETGTTIYYSDDGSIPTKRDGIAYSGPFVPAEDCIVKAIAYDTGNLKSLMVSFTAKGSGIVVFKDANLEAVAKAATTADVVVTLPDSTTTTVKGLGWDKDHDGVITLDDMRQVTSLRSFNSQKWVQYLDVLKYTRFTSMDTYQFFGCSNLKELNIPGTCKTTKGINNCTSLQKLVFEEGVTTVGAITNCTIVAMKLPESLTSFGGITNCGTSLKNAGGLVIPKNVTAFPSVYNTKVGRIKHLGNITTIPMNNLSYAGNVKVYLASNVVPTKTGTANQGTITELYVPDEMIPLYAESADWATMYSKGDIISIKYWVD